MPRIAKRRKVSAISAFSNRCSVKQGSIDGFGRVSKPPAQAAVSESEGKTQTHDIEIVTRIITGERRVAAAPLTSRTKKRKFVRFADEGTDLDRASEEVETVSSSLKVISYEGIKEESFSDGHRIADLQTTILDRASSPRDVAPSAEKPEKGDESSAELPPQLEDLLDLFSSFLTALSIHYAHHGIMIPADLRVLNRAIACTWGKRSVHVNDIRRILSILQATSTSPKKKYFHLSEYAHDKICVELDDHLQLRCSGNGILGRPLPEDQLNKSFHANLTRLYTSWSSSKSSHSASDFLATIPLTESTPLRSLAKLAPLLEKGQRRLSDFRASAAAARQKENQPVSSSMTATRKSTQPPPRVRNQSLLDRIRAKSAAQSLIPQTNIQASISRAVAVDRLPHLIQVLQHLSSTSTPSSSHPLHPTTSSSPPLSPQPSTSVPHRTTILLPTLLQHLRSNLSHPVSFSEADQAITLLATEIVPEWVEVFSLGETKAVVLKRHDRVGEVEMKERIERAREREV